MKRRSPSRPSCETFTIPRDHALPISLSFPSAAVFAIDDRVVLSALSICGVEVEHIRPLTDGLRTVTAEFLERWIAECEHRRRRRDQMLLAIEVHEALAIACENVENYFNGLPRRAQYRLTDQVFANMAPEVRRNGPQYLHRLADWARERQEIEDAEERGGNGAQGRRNTIDVIQ